MQLNGSSGSWWRRTRQRHNLWPPLVADHFNPTQTTATTAVVSGRKADKLDLWSVGFALYAPGCLGVFPYSCIQMFVSSWGDHHETPRPNWRSWNARKSDAGWWMWLNSDVCMYLQINVFLTGLGNSFHSFCRCHGHCGTTSTQFPAHLKSARARHGRKFPSTCLKSCSKCSWTTNKYQKKHPIRGLKEPWTPWTPWTIYCALLGQLPGYPNNSNNHPEDGEWVSARSEHFLLRSSRLHWRILALKDLASSNHLWFDDSADWDSWQPKDWFNCQSTKNI